MTSQTIGSILLSYSESPKKVAALQHSSCLARILPKRCLFGSVINVSCEELHFAEPWKN